MTDITIINLEFSSVRFSRGRRGGHVCVCGGGGVLVTMEKGICLILDIWGLEKTFNCHCIIHIMGKV